MKKIYFILVTCAAITGFAQTPLPYYTGFDNTQQTNGWTQYRKQSTVSGPWNIVTQQPRSAPACLYHGYPIGDPSTDWYVSPPFQLSNGGWIDSLWFAFGGFSSQPAAGDTIAIYALRDSPDPSLATSIIELLPFGGANYINDWVWRDTSGIYIPGYAGGPTYIAFRYTGNTSWLDVRFDDLRISEDIPQILPSDISISIPAITVCAGEPVQFQEQTPKSPTSWNWQFEGGSPATSTLHSPSVVYTVAGVYDVTLQVANAKGPATRTFQNFITISGCVGLETESIGEKISIYPNPGAEKLWIEGWNGGNYVVMDVSGHTILSGSARQARVEIDISKWPQGIYLVRLDHPAGSSTHKFIRY